MQITWIITEKDIQKVRAILAQSDNAFVSTRRKRNVEKIGVVIDKDTVIRTMMMCLLTSQQRSGPESRVARFLRLNPFPLSSDIIIRKNDLKSYTQQTLRDHDLKRYINRIADFFTQNIGSITNLGE